MAWNTDRRKRLPSNCDVLRRRQLELEGFRCCHIHSNGQRCGAKATDVDHIKAKLDDHSKLQSLCAFHHRAKSGREGAAGLAKKRKKISKSFRFEDIHPSDF